MKREVKEEMMEKKERGLRFQGTIWLDDEFITSMQFHNLVNLIDWLKTNWRIFQKQVNKWKKEGKIK